MLLAAMCVLLAACTGSVAGRGSFGGPAAPPGTAPAPAPALGCTGAKVIAPPAAPYCYLLPAGLVDTSGSVSVGTRIGQEKHRSAVALDSHDVIVVLVYELLADSDGVADQALTGELRAVLDRFTAQGLVFPGTPPERGVVDGARSFHYRATQAARRLTSDFYFVFRGRLEVEINCQWSEHRAELAAACAAVLKSLRIASLK
jgi:hypothetical protein